MNEDVALMSCNETELLWMARRQGLGQLRRGLPQERLVAIITGNIAPETSDFSGMTFTRRSLEGFIVKHYDRIASQLPGCSGKCTTFACSEGRHALCFMPVSEAI